MGVKVRQKVKGNGNAWWVFISHNGKRTSRKIGDKKAANVVASKIRQKLATGDLKIDEEKRKLPTFELFAKGFMDTYSKLNHAENTRLSYNDNLRLHINPVFGDKPLDEIERKDIIQKEIIQLLKVASPERWICQNSLPKPCLHSARQALKKDCA